MASVCTLTPSSSPFHACQLDGQCRLQTCTTGVSGLSSYTCVCNPDTGYLPDPVSFGCVDVNACVDFPCLYDHYSPNASRSCTDLPAPLAINNPVGRSCEPCRTGWVALDITTCSSVNCSSTILPRVNAVLANCTDSHFYGTPCTMPCITGHVVNGQVPNGRYDGSDNYIRSVPFTCQANTSWTGLNFSCAPISCGPTILTLKAGFVASCPNTGYAQKCSASCDAEHDGPVMQYQCAAQGVWLVRPFIPRRILILSSTCGYQ